MLLWDGVDSPLLIVQLGLGGSAIADPAAGSLVLDSLPGLDTATLGSVSWTDVAADMVTVSYSRGRATAFDQPSPGQATIVLDNYSGLYDPTNTASPYDITAGLPVRVRAQLLAAAGSPLYPGVALFPGTSLSPSGAGTGTSRVYELYRGVIDDIAVDVGWEPSVTLSCIDALEALGRAFVDATVSSFDGDTSGVRINRILDAALWPASMRALDGGRSLMQATTFGDNALPLAQAVANSEFGLLFVGGDGKLTFYDRYHEYSNARSITPQATFSDSGVDVDFESINVRVSRDTVANDVRLTRDGGEEQQAADLVSQAQYGLRTWSGPNTPMLRDDTAVLNAAQWLAVRFAAPAESVSDLQVDATAQGMWSTLLPLDLLDRVTVSRDYGPVTITRDLLVQQMSVEIGPSSWRYGFVLAPPVLRPDVILLNQGPALDTGRLTY